MAAWFALFVAIGALGTWLALRYALARALVDEPGERRSHSTPTPRGGGIALATAIAIASTAMMIRHPSAIVPLAAFLLGTTAVAAVGFIDDHRPLSARLRLFVHVVAACLFGLGLVAGGAPAWVAGATVLACIGLTNVWNFMDGIDGIAASQAAIVAAVLAALASGVWAWIAVALAAACIGFLPFNFPRARIFMGDVGSGTLGFALAGLGGAAAAISPEPRAVLAMLAMAASAFAVDACLTLARRIVRRERWWMPHTQHAYQVAARAWGHRRVTMGYAAWTAASIVASAGVQRAGGDKMWPLVAAWYACGALAWYWLQGRPSRTLQTDL